MNTTIITNEDRDSITSVRTFFLMLSRALLSPAEFFRCDINKISWNECIAFGLLGNWIGTLFYFLWSSVTSVFFNKVVSSYFPNILSQTFLANSAGMQFKNQFLLVLLSPILTFILIFLAAFITYLFSFFWVKQSEKSMEPYTLKNIVKVYSVAKASSFFHVVPFVGSIIYFMAYYIILIVGFRERFGFSTRRSMAIIFIPMSILFFIIFLFILILGALVIKYFGDLYPSFL